MMEKVYLDTETTGLCGPPIIVQYAIEEGPIQIHNFWTEPVCDSIALIEMFCQKAVVGFNLAFDWFQLAKMYTILDSMSKKGMDYQLPENHIDMIGMLEADCRLGPCIKPASACDLMLTARKTKYQITMNRSDIKIRRVPSALAWELAKELEERVVLNNILFARRKNKHAPHWTVVQSVNRATGNPNKDFQDVVLKFKPSVALKALAIDALGVDPDNVITFTDIEVDSAYTPIENKFAPFATSISTDKKKWKGFTLKGKKKIHGTCWPGVIEKHIDHWLWNVPAREYASKDVDYTRDLYKHFDSPNCGDDDSVLACSVGAVRWRGYAVDLEGIRRLRDEAIAKIGKYPTAPKKARAYVEECLDATELLGMKSHGTSKNELFELAKWANQDCPFCQSHPVNKLTCVGCQGKGSFVHPVAERALNVINTRLAVKEIELYDKILLAGRFHTSFKVIGTLSSRMSGADGLNPQGISHAKHVRKCFTFADGELILQGGDFDSFEVGLAVAAWGDTLMRDDILSGKKIHSIFAMGLYENMSYDEICASKGNKVFDFYDAGKRGLFSQMYGGNANTLVTKVGVSIEVAIRAEKRFMGRYPAVKKARDGIIEKFCSMKQPDGIGKRIYWDEPAQFVESLFGFRRYFTLENEICRALFALAQKLPPEMAKIKVKVQRRHDGSEQTASGATMSALFGAAFGIQGSNTRAAANHIIQSSGATITKAVQRKVWDLQPTGAGPWMVQPCNIHDEILCPTHPSMIDRVAGIVKDAVAEFRVKVPLIEMDWKTMKNWAEK